ncbi:hypothetical protein [Mycobacterium adipatum]|uniref:hypothetical protein n=1 Tax=Mycobacterium adipatum TaxID=1682113 RepID=UPI000ACF1F2B|nr:hypothetical protein [Mycobacterium adipatum]
MDIKEINGLVKSMTVSVFASLSPVWPEDIKECGGHGVLIARVDPICNHALNDVDVVARALVYMPSDEISESRLCRLTIRNSDLDLPKHYVKNAASRFRPRDYIEDERDSATVRLADYQRCAQALLPLPVINLHAPFRVWPVEQ